MTFKPPHLQARILKVYTEPLTMFRHVISPFCLSKTLLSQGHILGNSCQCRNSGWGVYSKDRRGGKEPPVAQMQLAGQLAVTILLITPSNNKEFSFCHIAFYKLLAISSSLNTQELGVLTPAQLKIPVKLLSLQQPFASTDSITGNRNSIYHQHLGMCCWESAVRMRKYFFLICSWLNSQLENLQIQKGSTVFTLKKVYKWSHDIQWSTVHS